MRAPTKYEAGLAGDDAPRYRAPNCTARPKQQLQVLVADEIYTIKNHAQLEFSRPLERGVLVHAGAQRMFLRGAFRRSSVRLEIRIVVGSAREPVRARKACDEILFEDFGFLGGCVCRQRSVLRPSPRKFSRTGNGTCDAARRQARREAPAVQPLLCFDLRHGPQRVDGHASFVWRRARLRC